MALDDLLAQSRAAATKREALSVLAAAELALAQQTDVAARTRGSHAVAQAFLGWGESQRAVALLRAALLRAPTDADTAAALSSALVSANLRDEALDVVSSGLKYSPAHYALLLQKAILSQQVGSPKQALLALEEAVAAHGYSEVTDGLIVDLASRLGMSIPTAPGHIVHGS